MGKRKAEKREAALQGWTTLEHKERVADYAWSRKTSVSELVIRAVDELMARELGAMAEQAQGLDQRTA